MQILSSGSKWLWSAVWVREFEFKFVKAVINTLYGLTRFKEKDRYASGETTQFNKVRRTVMRCVGSRDWKRRIVMPCVCNKRKRWWSAGWVHVSERGESLCPVWATNKKDGEALGGSTWLKEENRYALCEQQTKKMVKRWVGPRDWKRRIALSCVGTKRMVIVMYCVGSRD